MRSAVGTRPSPPRGLATVALAGALAAACQFDPSGPIGPDGGDGPGGTGSDARPDARPGVVDSGPTRCTPNQTVCDGRVLSRCSADGDGYSEHAVCAFTCEDDDHCTIASNLPEVDQRACDGGAPRLTPAARATVRLTGDGDGRITCDPDCGDGMTTSIDAAGTVDQSGAPDLAWFCLSALDLPAGLAVSASAGLSRSVTLLVAGQARIAGTLSVDGGDAATGAAGAAGPGGSAGGDPSAGTGQRGGGSCPGTGGQSVGGVGNSAGGGGGGGGFGSEGGSGGSGRTPGGNQVAPGGPPGSICGAADLEPLLGGSGGAGGGDGSCGDCGWPGGGGGGAIHIAAAGGIEVSGTISAAGGSGFGSTSGDDRRGGGGGGGAGGAILLEGPSLAVSPGALRVEGGRGGLAGAGAGGPGAAGTQAAGGGASADANTEGGAGGGGGGGRVRLNASARPSCSGAASPDNVCTADGLQLGGSFGGQRSPTPR